MNRRQAGFTLLEVMVATGILAGGLGIVVGGIGMSVRSTALASGYERARVVAESQLAEFVASRPSRAQQLSGDAQGVRWSLVAEPTPDEAGLLKVHIEASFFAAGGERSVRIETREVARGVPQRTEQSS